MQQHREKEWSCTAGYVDSYRLMGRDSRQKITPGAVSTFVSLPVEVDGRILYFFVPVQCCFNLSVYQSAALFNCLTVYFQPLLCRQSN
jgi:hypothetical protein